MKQPYELFVALRYLRARRRESFISFISLVSMIGIGLAVAVLIVVLSVMNGFEFELQQRILGMASHSSIHGYDGPLEDWQSLRERALSRPDVISAAPFVEGQGLALAGNALDSDAPDGDSSDGDALPGEALDNPAPRGEATAAQMSAGVSVRGVDPDLELTVSAVGEYMQAGSLQTLEPRSYRMVIGSGLARALNVGIGDELVLVLARGFVTPAGIAPRMRSFTVSGIFEAGMYEYDRGLVFVNIADGARIFGTDGRATALRLGVRDVYAAQAIAMELAQTLDQRSYVTDWTRQHSSFFSSIRLSKSIMFGILSMVIAVAAFNIVSTLVMVVRDKKGDIAILRSLGASPRSIMALFANQGIMIGLAGTLLGVVLGLLVTTQLQHVVGLIETALDVDLLSAEVYFLGELPSQIRSSEILRICIVAVVLAVAATVYPALSAARQPPAEALRYE